MITAILRLLKWRKSMVRIYLPVMAMFLTLALVYHSAAIHAEEKKTAGAKPRSQTANVPDHEVQYEDTLSPDWKKNWDLARELYRDKKYREALIQYELLLSQKESCDEARWEYATLLIRQAKWQQAGEQLDMLMTNDPDNRDYRFALAEVDGNTGKIDKAVELYQKLYATSTETSVTVRALEGLVRSFEQKDDSREVSLYLEKLIAQKPDVPELRIKLARLYLESNRLADARQLLANLEQDFPENPAVLRLQAELQKKLGDVDAEAAYRQKLVAADPDDMVSHTMLQQYYQGKNDWLMSLKHLEILLKKTPNDADILDTAADLNIKLDRVDRALEYYDYILAVQPNNKTVLHKKKEAQKLLAEDLVVLVEHDGGEKLWQDLVKVTSDRAGVYREIAHLLRKKGNTEELIKVLTLICLEDPSDEATLAELTALLKEKGRNSDLNELLAKLRNNELE